MTFRTGESEGTEPAVCSQLETSIRYPERQQCGRTNTRFPSYVLSFCDRLHLSLISPPSQQQESCSTVLQVHKYSAALWGLNSTRLLPPRVHHVCSTWPEADTTYRAVTTHSTWLGLICRSNVVKSDIALNEVILMCVIPVVCITNWRGKCSQTTQLSQKYVVF